MDELTDREERTVQTPVRRPLGPVRHRHAPRQARRVSRPPRRRPPDSAVRAELPRQPLRLQGARRRADPVGERGRQPEGGVPAARHRRARSILRSDQRAHQHVLRPWPRRRTWRSRIRSAAALAAIAADCGGGRRGDRPSRRHVREHGRPAVLDAGRVDALPVVGHGRHRHDEPAGGEARARGGDLLRDAGARHRLRLLASRPRFGDGRPDRREPDAECRHGAEDDRRGGGADRGSPYLRLCDALATAIITRPEHIPAEVKRDLAPIIGHYLQ